MGVRLPLPPLEGTLLSSWRVGEACDVGADGNCGADRRERSWLLPLARRAAAGERRCSWLLARRVAGKRRRAS